MNKKLVLAYSGGLDTSVMIRWIKENTGYDVIACIVDVGQNENTSAIRKRALDTGASKAYVVDAKEEFVRDFIFPALKAEATYEGKYLLGTALARPVIAKKVVEAAKKENAEALAHGATGKGNDQVRFEVTFRALEPHLKIVAPWREWNLKSREDEIAYARKYGIPIPVTKSKPYSMDANLWHISYEGGILENPDAAPQEDMFQLTVSPEKAPDKPSYVELTFEKGIPVSINGKKYGPVELIKKLNSIGGRNAVGRVDMVENRLVGMKSRGVYECPASTLLYTAHKELEMLTLERETYHNKLPLSLKYGELVYYGAWYSPLKDALDGFIEKTQKYVTGSIVLKLLKGNVAIAGRSSKYSLYQEKLATFGKGEIYNPKHAEGFIKLFGLPVEIYSASRPKK
ncbi:MAG: argininosuccinate synthase [Elusimicrobiota bacterium]